MVVRTTSYSLPEHIHGHVDVIQPTTMFGLLKPMRTTSHWDEDEIVEAEFGATARLASGATVDLSCNTTITPTCLKQLYEVCLSNIVARTPSDLRARLTTTVQPTTGTALVSLDTSNR